MTLSVHFGTAILSYFNGIKDKKTKKKLGWHVDLCPMRLRCHWGNPSHVDKELISSTTGCFSSTVSGPLGGWPWETPPPLGCPAWVCPERGEDLYRYRSDRSQTSTLRGDKTRHVKLADGLKAEPGTKPKQKKKRKKELCVQMSEHRAAYFLSPSQTDWAGSDGNVGHPSQAATEEEFSVTDTLIAYALTWQRIQCAQTLESTPLSTDTPGIPWEPLHKLQWLQSFW